MFKNTPCDRNVGFGLCDGGEGGKIKVGFGLCERRERGKIKVGFGIIVIVER